MEFKPRIFIGSSLEGYDTAVLISNSISDIAETYLWKQAFEYGNSNYENLVSQIALYDYAILIATADDIVISRNAKFESARDNVLFEFGLFSGGLGRKRTFYIIENNTKIPTDLFGVSLPFIAKKTDPNYQKTIEDCVFGIKKHIKNKELTFNLSFLPSTALAYGYFVNFVERTVERLLEDKKEKKIFHLQNDKSFIIAEIRFTILIPDDLTDDMFKKVKSKRLKDGWEKLKVDPKDVRDYDFSIDISQIENGVLHLVDIPYTLNALNMAIELYSKKDHIGKDEKGALLEYREIRNFKRTLEYLANKSPITRDIVRLEIVDI